MIVRVFAKNDGCPEITICGGSDPYVEQMLVKQGYVPLKSERSCDVDAKDAAEPAADKPKKRSAAKKKDAAEGETAVEGEEKAE